MIIVWVYDDVVINNVKIIIGTLSEETQLYLTQLGINLLSKCSFPLIYPKLKSKRLTFNCFCNILPTFYSRISS